MANLEYNINFKWWNDSAEIPETHISELEENALSQISTMATQGYIAGNLKATVVNQDETEVEYSGFWEIKKVVD